MKPKNRTLDRIDLKILRSLQVEVMHDRIKSVSYQAASQLSANISEADKPYFHDYLQLLTPGRALGHPAW